MNGKKAADFSDLVFRVMFSLIFIVGGAGHFFAHDYMLNRIQGSPWLWLIEAIASPSLLLWLSGGVMIISGIMVAAGFKTRLAALALFAALAPITFTIHVAPGHMGPLLKNVALLGVLIHLYFRGPGAYSLDNRTV